MPRDAVQGLLFLGEEFLTPFMGLIAALDPIATAAEVVLFTCVVENGLSASTLHAFQPG